MVDIKNTLKTVFLGLSLLIVANFAYAATITAKVDRQQISEGESFQLTLEVKGDPDGNPDFSPLQTNFEILGRNKSSSMQIINGSINSKVVWTLTLMPKQMGELTIPPIDFGTDHSNSVNITVSKAQAAQAGTEAEDIFLRVSAKPTQTYVQAQIIYTIRVYVSTDITDASLSQPSLSDADAVIEKLGEDQRFETEYQGRPYQVVERRYAIFPQQSGKLKISPVVFNAQLVEAPRFRMIPFPQYGQTKRIQSKAIELNIKAIPDTQKATTWLPARHIRLQDEWSKNPQKIKVGEAVTRTLTITADGLTAAQLPEIVAKSPVEFKSYPDQPSLNDQKKDNGVIGIRQEKIAMIASKPGHYVLPAINISWWNTVKHRQEVARLPKREIDVAPGAPGSGTPPSTTGLPENKAAPQPVTTLPIAPLTAPTKSGQASAPVTGFWPWLSLVLAIGWLGTLFIVWRLYRNRPTDPGTDPARQAQAMQASRKLVEKQLKQACLANNTGAAKQAILAWAKTLDGKKNLNSLSELGEYLGGPIAAELNTLNRALYSPTVNNWQGRQLWDAIQAYQPVPVKTRSREVAGLAPLYPQ